MCTCVDEYTLAITNHIPTLSFPLQKTLQDYVVNVIPSDVDLQLIEAAKLSTCVVVVVLIDEKRV